MRAQIPGRSRNASFPGKDEDIWSFFFCVEFGFCLFSRSSLDCLGCVCVYWLRSLFWRTCSHVLLLKQTLHFGALKKRLFHRFGESGQKQSRPASVHLSSQRKCYDQNHNLHQGALQSVQIMTSSSDEGKIPPYKPRNLRKSHRGRCCDRHTCRTDQHSVYRLQWQHFSYMKINVKNVDPEGQLSKFRCRQVGPEPNDLLFSFGEGLEFSASH